VSASQPIVSVREIFSRWRQLPDTNTATEHRRVAYYPKNARVMLETLASTNPTTLACMRASARCGDGAALLLALADSLSALFNIHRA
jgi:hypothetical protein